MEERDTKNPLWHHRILSYCPGRWGWGTVASAGQLQGPGQPLVLPPSLSRTEGEGRAPPQGWIWEKSLGRRNAKRAATPGIALALASPRRARAAARPDNSRVSGGFRCLTSYKMFANRIYPVARRSQSRGRLLEQGGSGLGASPFVWERGAAVRAGARRAAPCPGRARTCPGRVPDIPGRRAPELREFPGN